MRTNKRKFLLWMALPALLLCSCISEQFDGNDPHPTAEEETSVRVSLLMPASSPKTYAISEIDENEVSTVDVLAFKPVTPDAQHPSGWAFAYKAAGTAITAQPGDNPVKAKKQFTVTLIKNTTQQLFVVLANIRDEVDALGDIAQGADRDELLARLVIENAGSWNANNDGSKQEGDPDRFRPFPMWGEVAATLTDGVTEISDVKILRSIARLDVVLGEQVLTDDNFTLDEIYIYNSKNKGFAVPDPANISGGKATAATVPANAADYALWNNAAPLVCDVPAAMETAFERTVYLFEAKAVAQDKSSEATCIVVGGTFGTDADPTYYRLDFLEPDKKTYKDIRRNHRYRANIIKVEGRGYATPEDAFNSKSLNILAEILEWDDGAIGDIVFDGQYYLGVSPTEFVLFKDPKAGNTFTVKTDVPGGWDIIGTSDTDAPNSSFDVDWISITNPASPYHGDAGVSTVTFSVEENNTSGPRTAYIHIAAGRLRFPVKVTQGAMPELGIWITDESGYYEIHELVFSAPADQEAEPQTFKVRWAPVASTVDISKTRAVTGGTQFIYAAASTDKPGEDITSISDGTGKKIFTILPPALTQNEIDLNPFLERASKVDFTVWTGTGYETKNIFLRQVNFNTVATTAGYYMLNGSSYSFTVKSNTAWVISDIDNSGGILDVINMPLIGKSGGYNTFGETVNFKLVTDDDGTKNGKTATLTLTDPTGRMTDVTVTIKGATCGSNGTARSLPIGNNNYLTHMYGGKCWMVQNSKEGTSTRQNFGEIGGISGDYPGPNNGEHYYDSTDASTACPDGWRLPDGLDFNALIVIVYNNATNRNAPEPSNICKWWTTSYGINYGAFKGFKSWGGNPWMHWNVSGDYWSSTRASDYRFFAESWQMPSGSGALLSVRCVRD